MSNKFTPIEYLSEQDKRILQETKHNINNTRSKRELSYYESILDSLLKKALRAYNDQNNKKKLQEA